MNTICQVQARPLRRDTSRLKWQVARVVQQHGGVLSTQGLGHKRAAYKLMRPNVSNQAARKQTE